MALDSQSLARFRAFHAAVEAITSTALWKDDELRSGVVLGFGPGIHVHRKDLPDLERFRSLMLDFRQLIAHKDAANLKRITNLVSAGRDSDGWHADELAVVAEARERFDAALDQLADMYSVPTPDAPRPAVRQLLEDWINGDWFHRDQVRRQRRKSYEFSADGDLSLLMIVPAVREAIKAAIEIDEVLVRHLGAVLVD